MTRTRPASSRCLVRTAAAGVAALAFGTASVPVFAEPRARLSYEATPAGQTCPDESSFRSLVTARLGRDPFDAAATDRASVDVKSAGGRLRGHVLVQMSGKTQADRTIAAGSGECETLVEALAAVTALAIDPDAAVGATVGPRREALPALPSSPAPAPAEPPTRTLPELVEYRPGASAPPTRATRLNVATRGLVVGSLGILPGPSAGGEAGIGLEAGRFAIFLEGRAETKLTTAGADPADRIDATLLTAGIAPCGTVDVLYGCIVTRVGVSSSAALDATASRDESAFTASLGLRAGLRIRLGGGLAFTPQLEMVVPLVRTTLYFDREPVWKTPLIAGSLGFGLLYVFE